MCHKNNTIEIKEGIHLPLGKQMTRAGSYVKTCWFLYAKSFKKMNDGMCPHRLCATHSSLPQSPASYYPVIRTIGFHDLWISSVQFSRSVMSNSLRPHELQHTRPPVHQQLLEFTQTHVHRVGDAIQPSHPLSYPPPPAPNSYQHQGLFQWVNSWHQVAKVLEFQLQHQSFQWIPGWISLQSKGLSRVFSNTTVQKHQLFGAQLSSQSNSHIHTWPLEKP